MKVELKPCPFCGSKDVIFRSSSHGEAIRCKKCLADVAFVDFVCCATSANATIEKWNSRQTKEEIISEFTNELKAACKNAIVNKTVDKIVVELLEKKGMKLND